MSESQKKYDFFVIGAGSGGVRAARIAASHGAKVGIAEERHMGGTCVNIGCVPKKLFAYGSDFHMDFEDAAAYGWKIGKGKFHWPTLRDNKNKEIKRLNRVYENLLKNNNVDIYEGHAQFIDKNTLDINGQTAIADKILIATGGAPRKPDISGAEYIITSDDAFYMTTFPKKVVIIGGGYIAVEFAHILHGLGADVTLTYRGDMFLRGFDQDIRETLADEMKKQGINLQFNTDIEEVIKKGKSYIAKTKQGNNIKCDLVMAAIGRDALTDTLNLKAASIATEKNGQIKINDKFQTSTKNIYAVGDVSNHHNLTPVALAEGHALADTLFGNTKGRTVSYENIPTAVFSHPPIATVGLTEEDALANGHKIDVYQSKFTPMKHSMTGRNEKTFMKLIVEKKIRQSSRLPHDWLGRPRNYTRFGCSYHRRRNQIRLR